MLRPCYVNDFPTKADVFMGIKEKILSTSRSQVTLHGSKTFTKPYYRNPTADYLLNCFSRCRCTDAAAPRLHTGVNCFYRVLCHALAPQIQRAEFGTLKSPCYKESLAPGGGEESQVRAVTLRFYCCRFYPRLRWAPKLSAVSKLLG